jgi:excisionase family DNA binding protein
MEDTWTDKSIHDVLDTYRRRMFMADQIDLDKETVQDEFWTRKQAAEFLEVSEKAIQRYTNKNLLTVEYKDNPKGGGKLSVYRADEVRRLKNKDMRHVQDDNVQDTIQDNALVPTVPNGAFQKSSIIQDTKAIQLSWTGVQFEKIQELSNYLKGIEAHMSQMAKPKKEVPIESKLLLTIKEAAMLSNISQENLRKAIKDGALKGGAIGKGLKVRREDLNAYIANLY